MQWGKLLETTQTCSDGELGNSVLMLLSAGCNGQGKLHGFGLGHAQNQRQWFLLFAKELLVCVMMQPKHPLVDMRTEGSPKEKEALFKHNGPKPPDSAS